MRRIFSLNRGHKNTDSFSHILLFSQFHTKLAILLGTKCDILGLHSSPIIYMVIGFWAQKNMFSRIFTIKDFFFNLELIFQTEKIIKTQICVLWHIGFLFLI